MDGSQKIVVASAPAKVILFGEHCVVLGTTAIATAISLRTYVQSESNQTNSCTLNISLKSNLLSYSWKLEDLAFTDKIGDFNDNEQLGNFVKSKTNDVNPQYLAPACQSFLLGCLLFGRGQSVTSTVKSQIPVGVGLGSSGAYNVSLALSLMNMESISTEGYEKVKTYSLLFERFMHGNPSGIDNATSTYGGIVTFKKGVINTLPGMKFKILITDTTIQRNTKLLVQKVGGLHSLFPDVVDPILQSVESICQRVISGFRPQENSINQNDEDIQERELAVRSQMELLMTVNHHLLGSLGVGHKALDTICEITREKQLHSKLTGAGGGGCAITLLKADVDEVMQKLKDNGFNCFFVDIAESGVTLHPSIPERNDFQ